MEAKAKSGAPKPSAKVEKKDSSKTEVPPAEPAAPAPEPEKPAEEAPADTAETGGGCPACLENLKPFLIGGAVVALGAVLIGAILLAKKN